MSNGVKGGQGCPWLTSAKDSLMTQVSLIRKSLTEVRPIPGGHCGIHNYVTSQLHSFDFGPGCAGIGSSLRSNQNSSRYG